MAIVATVMTAGIAGVLVGATLEGGGGLFALGSAVLGGGATSFVGVSLATGFAAGFIGNVASQGVATALKMQESINLKGAFISGLSTAATAGILRGLNDTKKYKDVLKSMDKLSTTKEFNVLSAGQLMAQNTLSQSIGLTLQRHQHFDWEQLAVAGVTGGLMGGVSGRKLDEALRTVDHNKGALSSGANALALAGLHGVVKGSHFNATQVIIDTLGNVIGTGVVGLDKQTMPLTAREPFITGDALYLTETAMDIIHPERSLDEIYLNYIARQLSESEGHESPSEHLGTKHAQSLGNYERLSFDSDLLKSNNQVENPSFESKVYWNSKEHGMAGFVRDFNIDVDAMEPQAYAADIIKSFIPERHETPEVEYSKTRKDLPDSNEEMFQLNQFPILNSDEALKNCATQEMLKELLILMTQELPNDLELMKIAFKAHDYPLVEKTAHKIKGGAIYVGTIRMKYACQYVERYWKTGQRELFEALYHQAINTIEETLTYIEGWLQRYTPYK